MAFSWKIGGIAACVAVLTAGMPEPSHSAGLRAGTPNTANHAAVQRINHEGGRWKKRRSSRYHPGYAGTAVDAPFTRVETGYQRRVEVDAPFTTVRVGRRGVWVRAPFVNLFVPH